MAPGGCGGAKRRHRARRGPSSGRLGHSAPATHARPHQAKGTGTNSPRIAKGYLTKDSVLPPPAPCVPDPGSPSAPTQEREARGRSGLKMFTAVVWRPSPNEKNSQGKQSGSEGGHLCFAHLARITRCKLLQPLRHRCQFMERTTVKFVLRKSFDLTYLRKMC